MKAPKGGRKGGTTFPRIGLEKALLYSDKLVSKTHTGGLPESTILAGVFGTVGGEGQVRASALRQYGLLEGDRTAYSATALAREIDAALDDQKPALLQRALLSSKLFHEIFQTFQDDTVSRAKIRQRAQALNVHPDSAEEAAETFMVSAVTAGVGTMDGENITLGEAPGAVSANGNAGRVPRGLICSTSEEFQRKLHWALLKWHRRAIPARAQARRLGITALRATTWEDQLSIREQECHYGESLSPSTPAQRLTPTSSRRSSSIVLFAERLKFGIWSNEARIPLSLLLFLAIVWPKSQ